MPRPSKSEAIRRLLESEPGLQPAAIRDRLAERGIMVDTHLVKVVRADFRKVLEVRMREGDKTFRAEWRRCHARAERAYRSRFEEWAKTCPPYPGIPKMTISGYDTFICVSWPSSASFGWIPTGEAEAEFEAEFDVWFSQECRIGKATVPPRHPEFQGVYEEPPDYPERPDQAEFYAALILHAVGGAVPEGELHRLLHDDSWFDPEADSLE